MIYFDQAATTKIHPKVSEWIKEHLDSDWMNPSSLYAAAQKNDIEACRKKILGMIGADLDDYIVFTSGGSEANALAINGADLFITTEIEHDSILNCEMGARLSVDSAGLISYVDFERIRNISDMMRPWDILSIQYGNNEIGTIQPIADITEIAHKAGALMFTDAVQAVGAVDIDLSKLKVDMLSLSGHKLHAPKGIGMLYVRKGVFIDNLIDGGGQEKRKRGGTENVPYIVGLAKAIEIASARIPELDEVRRKRDRLISELTKIPYSKLNGHPTERLSGNVNVGFEFIEGESILMWLDMAGICASTGSACSSASLDPSHVLLATGVPHEKAHGSIRLSITHETTDEDIDYILEVLPPIIERLRDMSPLWEEIVNKSKQ